LNPDWLYAACHHDHPSLIQRLLNIPDDDRPVCKDSVWTDDSRRGSRILEPLIQKEDKEDMFDLEKITVQKKPENDGYENGGS